MTAPFVLFADARTGSTSLLLAIQRRTRMVSEPFHPQNGSFEQTRKGALRFLAWLKSEQMGAKHLSAHLDIYGNAEILRDEEVRIVMLTRDNILQQAVSWYIMEGTQNWHSQDEAKESAARLSRIEYHHLYNLIQGILGRRAIYGNLAAKRPLTHSTIYEKLYSPDALSELNAVLRFLELPEASQDDPDVVSFSARQRINTPDTYSLIENIEEVEAIFSGEALGNLFDA
jgi:LPS sulfotransferase NodH